MKIFLSKKWQYEMKAMFYIETICIILGIISFLNNVAVMIFMLLSIFLVMTVVEIICFFCVYRILTYTIDKETSFESYLFKKKLCIIDKTKSIYYSIFEANEGMFSRKKYIALSNEPFEYRKNSSLRIFPWDDRPLLVSYDVKKQIVMPYDEKTKAILKIDTWHSII